MLEMNNDIHNTICKSYYGEIPKNVNYYQMQVVGVSN
jgi:hypothetical protein